MTGVLTQTSTGVKSRFAVKTVIAAVLVAMAVVLPQVVHAAFGASGGAKWLPMYLPVIVAGCVLGWKFGLAVGVLSPVVSFALTAACGTPMPNAVRLPYMVIELAVFAAVAGAFSSRIQKNGLFAFAAVLAAAVCGRVAFIATVAIFQTVSPLGVSAAWSQIVSGFSGLALQAVIVPFVVMGLSRLMKGGRA